MGNLVLLSRPLNLLIVSRSVTSLLLFSRQRCGLQIDPYFLCICKYVLASLHKLVVLLTQFNLFFLLLNLTVFELQVFLLKFELCLFPMANELCLLLEEDLLQSLQTREQTRWRISSPINGADNPCIPPVQYVAHGM